MKASIITIVIALGGLLYLASSLVVHGFNVGTMDHPVIISLPKAK